MGKYADRKANNKCVRCGCREPEHNSICCTYCKQKRKEARQRRHSKLAATGTCRCGSTARPGKTLCEACASKYVESAAEWRKSNPGYYRRRSRQLFLEVLNHYGGPKCACCGETNIFFLTIDHINSDGHKQHRGDRKRLAYWLKKNDFPDGYQVLCFNCNCGRARNDGICPHKQKAEWF